MRRFLPSSIRPITLVAIASIWMASVGNLALWRELSALGLLQAQSGWVLAATMGGLIAAAVFALLSLLAWRGVLKPVVVFLLAATAIGAHFMFTFRVVIDSTMITNALQTDWHETKALLGPQLLLTLLLGAVLPSWLIWRADIPHAHWPRQMMRNLLAAGAGVVVIAALIMASFQPMSSAMRNHKQLRYLMNPLNSLYAVALATVGERRRSGPLLPIGQDARLASQAPRPPLLVLVLGETGRSGNFSINGYARDTTPELAKAGVATFRNAWSCGTSTAASVPCMFSHLGREGFQARTQDSEGLMDVLRRAGLAVLWIDNQAGGCKGVCDRVSNVNTSGLDDTRYCSGGECRDGILLEGLDARIAALPEADRKRGIVLAMHQMGSHGPAYSLRSPPAFKRFLPECTSAHLPDCSQDQLVNAYDNTIAYTDHVLGSTIDWLRRQQAYDTALLYVADHGESLGENNIYLHGMPYSIAPDVQKHVPWVTWLSPGFEQRGGPTMACLRKRADMKISHDHLFHSVLGLLQVQTGVYQRTLDAYADCAAP